MDYEGRVNRFRQQMAAASVDIAFLPISADLQYLTGIPRDMPNFGAVIYPGRWLEGAFITQTAGPIITLPRMTAENHYGGALTGNVRVIADRDDPMAVGREVLSAFKPGDKPRIALGNYALGETAVNLQKLLPGVVFSSATELLRPLRRIKSADEIEVMREAGTVTEAAFTEVLAKLKHGITEAEIESEIDYQLRKHNAIGPSFTTAMYNSGPNHPVGFGHANKLKNAPLLPTQSWFAQRLYAPTGVQIDATHLSLTFAGYGVQTPNKDLLNYRQIGNVVLTLNMALKAGVPNNINAH